MLDWNSQLYMKFEPQRTRAARDLLSHIVDIAPKLLFDIGCGPGNSTELLRNAFPNARIVGVDCSSNMLDVARARVPTAEFLQEDAEFWSPSEKADVIFANATLHFLPNHHRHIERYVANLTPGGCFAVQMPYNMQEASHAAMRMISADGPWADRLVPIAKTRVIVGPPEEYYALLTPSCRSFDVWQTIYFHSLEGPDNIVEWFEGAELQPFLAPLNPHEAKAFLARYREELTKAYAPQPDGRILLRYPRLFFVARK